MQVDRGAVKENHPERGRGGRDGPAKAGIGEVILDLKKESIILWGPLGDEREVCLSRGNRNRGV